MLRYMSAPQRRILKRRESLYTKPVHYQLAMGRVGESNHLLKVCMYYVLACVCSCKITQLLDGTVLAGLDTCAVHMHAPALAPTAFAIHTVN